MAASLSAPAPTQFAEGELESFDVLYRRYARMVHGILVSRVPYGEVDDLMQETFAIAFQRIGQLRDPRSFGGWLAMIARNFARNAMRGRERRPEALPPEVLDQRPATDRRALQELFHALQDLPEAYRETLTLRLVEELGASEIAQLTGMTPGSVRVNLHRGMKILREKLEREGWK